MKEKLDRLAAINKKNRADPRFVRTMAFLIGKGFLKYNRPLPETRIARCDLREAIWAGKKVEPRILEVLPAALARLPRHFRIPIRPTAEEQQVIRFADGLRKEPEGEKPLFGIDPKKFRFWMELPLKDGRTRVESKRKRIKTFRLDPEAIQTLSTFAEKNHLSETEALEKLIFQSRLST